MRIQTEGVSEREEKGYNALPYTKGTSEWINSRNLQLNSGKFNR